MNENDAPVKAGEMYEVSIGAIGGKGDGIAKVRGFVLFVPNVKKDDYVKIKITKVLEKVGFAEVVEKLERPVREQKYETVSAEEMHTQDEEPESQYDDTDDFGKDLDEE